MKTPRYEIIEAKPFLFFFEKKKYRLLERLVYHDPVTGKKKTVPEGRISDGATGAIDVHGGGWWVHDEICEYPSWDDGTPITAWEAARVLSDIQKSQGNRIRSVTWRWATFLFGCKGSRRNGWV